MIELRIFNSILHGSLRVSSDNALDDKWCRNILTKEFISPSDIFTYHQHLKEVLSDHSNLFLEEELDIYLKQEEGDYSPEVHGPLINIETPTPYSSSSRFYTAIISNEVTRLSSSIIMAICKDLIEDDRKFIVQNAIAEIKDLLRNITIANSTLETQDQLATHVLATLKYNVIRLLLEVELLFDIYLKYPQSTNEELFLELLQEEMPPESFYSKSNLFTKINDRLIDYLKFDNKPKSSNTKKLSFEFKGDKDSLLNVLNALNNKIDLLKYGKTSIDDLYTVLTTRDITKSMKPIYLDCKTNKFAYIIKQLKTYFSGLTYKTIEASNLFYSSTGNVLKANNISSSVPNGDFDLKEEIDKILNNMK